jgi:hypothetical protein
MPRVCFAVDSETILMSCSLFKFNDYKKKQERNLMVTTAGVYNLKEKSTWWSMQPFVGKSTLKKLKPSPSARSGLNSCYTSPTNTTTAMPAKNASESFTVC